MSKQWIDDSLTEFVDRSEFWNLTDSSSLGYLWQKDFFPGLLRLPEDAWCRAGLIFKYGGVQIICLDPSSERVVATLRDAFPPYANFEVSSGLFQGQELNIAATAMNDMISFQDPREGFRSDKCGNFANEKKCTKAGCAWDDAGGSGALALILYRAITPRVQSKPRHWTNPTPGSSPPAWHGVS